MALFGSCFLVYKPAVADLLWEKNIVPRLISRADKLSRTGGMRRRLEWNHVPISCSTLCTLRSIRLSILMNLYIYSLYILVIKILSSISNSPAFIHPLYHPLSTVGPTCHFIWVYLCEILFWRIYWNEFNGAIGI
jgi:hypothetical protein